MTAAAPIRDGSRDSLLRAFEAFQQQSQKLEENHRALQEQIREVKERLTSVLSAIADAVFLVDPAGRILTANSAALALFGARREEELPILATALASLAAPLAAGATHRYPHLPPILIYIRLPIGLVCVECNDDTV